MTGQASRAGDLATVAAGFGAALRAEGVPVGPDRSERFARAVLLTDPDSPRQLYWCAQATLLSDPAESAALDRVFQMLFGGMTDPATDRGQPGPPETAPDRRREVAAAGTGPPQVHRDGPVGTAGSTGSGNRQQWYPALAASAERLATRDFAELTSAELVALGELMRRLRVATPPRTARRTVARSRGPRVDLRATLRHAGRTAGHPVRLRRRRHRQRPRRLVVLCDISGSMAPYARAMLHLLYAAVGGARCEVFTFATRLTRLTRVLSRVSPAVAIQRAGRAAPDWSGGTRIGAALKEFLDRYGVRGMARGAVVLVVSDGWETGEPAELGRQMARLSRLAYRIVWANPRTASARYRPLVGGMAAAWPYCDAVVSAHRLAALEELLDAVGAARGSRPHWTGRRPSPAGDG